MGQAAHGVQRYSAVAQGKLTASLVERIAESAAKNAGEINVSSLAAEFDQARGPIADLARDPRFVALVNHKVDIYLSGDGKRASVGFLVKLVRDENAADQHRLRAAEIILSRTTPPAQHMPESDNVRDLSEMSADELRGLVDVMQSELSTRAKVVENVRVVDLNIEKVFE